MIGALGLVKSKWFAGGVIGLVVITTIYFGYRNYSNLQDEVEMLHAANAQTTLALDIQTQSVLYLGERVEEWKEAQADLEQTIKEMQDESHEARAEARRLRQMFAEIDWEAMSPAAVDSVATDTIDRLWGLIQSASSGSEPGDGGAAPDEAGTAGAGASDAASDGVGSDRDSGRADAGASSEGVREPGVESR